MGRWLRRFAWMLLGAAIAVPATWLARDHFTITRPLREARAAFAAKQYLLAYELTQKHVRQKDAPYVPAAAALAARSLVELGRFEEADALFRGLPVDEEGEVSSWVRALVALHRPDDAIALCERFAPRFSGADFLRAQVVALTERRRIPEARAAAQKLRAIPGEEIAGDLMLGNIENRASKPAEAARHLAAALERDLELKGQPVKTERVVGELCESLVQLDRFDEAAGWAYKAFARFQSPALACIAAGVEVKRVQPEAAQVWFKRALEIDREFVKAMLGLGDLELAGGKPGPALRWFEKAAALAPDVARAAAGIAAARRRIDGTSGVPPATPPRAGASP
ncbi:MAG TPA: hypothetical protein VNC50_01505, partial [Planctomycetia bacterium]|nr:hypothetical protein [Planctomycetia bacterium]